MPRDLLKRDGGPVHYNTLRAMQHEIRGIPED